MSLDKLEIFNLAISLVGGQTPIQNINDKRPEAGACRTWYKPSRLLVLNEAFWPSVRRTVILTQIAENDFADAWQDGDPPLPWRFAYELPDDFITGRYVYNAADISGDVGLGDVGGDPNKNEFTIEYFPTTSERVLVTNTENAVLTYTADDQDTLKWDMNLVHAVAYELAANIALQLTGNVAVSEAMKGRKQQIVENMKLAQANEDHLSLTEPVSQIIQSRTGYTLGTQRADG